MGDACRAVRPARDRHHAAVGWSEERGRGKFHVVVLGRSGALHEADRGQRDIDEVELVGERFDDTAEPIEVVADERLAQVGPQDLRPPLAQVRHRRQVGDLELRVGRVLDVPELAVLARLDERDGRAFAAGSTGPPDPMDVLVRVGRDVVVDDVRDVVDVQAASRHVRRHEDVQRSVAEAAHHPVPTLLGQAAVERAGVVATGTQRLGEIVDLAAGPREHQRRGRVLDVEDPAQRRQLVVATDDVGDLADARRLAGGHRLGVDRDPDRFAQVPLGDARDRRARSSPRTGRSDGSPGSPTGSSRGLPRTPCRASRPPRRGWRPRWHRSAGCRA